MQHTLAVAVTIGTLFCLIAGSRADEVTARHGDWLLTVSQKTASEVERLAFEVLTSSSYEARSDIATQERWDQALRGQHIHIVFDRPRTFSFLFSTIGRPAVHDVQADELLIPLGPTDYALIRSGGHVRAFAKFSCESLTELRKAWDQPHP